MTGQDPPPRATPTLAAQIMPLLVAHCPGIQCRLVGACCYARCHAVAPLAAAAAAGKPVDTALAASPRGKPGATGPADATLSTDAELVALRRFRDAIDRANLAYHAGTLRYDLLTLERAIRVALKTVQDELDALDGDGPR